MALQLEEIAPDFSGEDQFGNVYRIRNYKGWKRVMLIFYSYDWSPICTIQISEIQRDLQRFRDEGMLVLGISVDSHYSHKAWAERYGIQFPLLSDYLRKISTDYNVLDEKGCARNTIYFIGRDGRIKYVKSCNPGEKPSNETLLNKVKELKSVEGF